MRISSVAIVMSCCCLSVAAVAETLNFASPAAPRVSIHSQLVEPLGAFTAMIFVNRDTYESLPDAAREAIDIDSGLSLLIWGGGHMQADLEQNRGRVAAQEDRTTVNIAPDGTRVLEAFREEIRVIQESGE